MATGQPPQPVNPAALSVEEMARLVSAAGGRKVTPEQVQADLDAGAPIGAGGKINLIHYAAWLTRESASEAIARPGERNVNP